MTKPRTVGPVVGLTGLLGLLGALGVTVGLHAGGWLAGITVGVATNLALTLALARSGAADLGAGNRVTLTRATLVAGVAALVADSLDRPVPVAALAGLTAVALVLDGVDGRVARRTGTVTPVGARFDMEVDAFLILLLSIHLTRSTGAWVLCIGAARYAFGAAGWLLPWLRGVLPPRPWRKVVAATQGIVLASVATELLPRPLATALLVAALGLLAESFGRDVWTLWSLRCSASVRDETRDALNHA